jgi:hypothetical protein
MTKWTLILKDIRLIWVTLAARSDRAFDAHLSATSPAMQIGGINVAPTAHCLSHTDLSQEA